LKPITILLLAWTLHGQNRPQFVWQGEVDGSIVLHLHGHRADVQVQDGAPVQNQQFHFNDPLPEVRQNVRVEVLQGRGYAHVIDQPRLENGYTLAIAIEDRQPGSSFYSIALFWDASSRAFEGGRNNKSGKVTWSGLVDEEAVVSCQAKSCVSSSAHGAAVANERFKFSRPLPGRDQDVTLEDIQGRGEIHLLEQPRERNHYTARVSIRDPQGGSGDYSFTLVWSGTAGTPAPVPEPAGRGLLWSGTVAGRIRVTVQGGAVFSQVLAGRPAENQRSDLVRPLPARADLAAAIQKLRGRGRVAIVETPSEQNNYRLIFEIDDPGPGADSYEVELDW